MSWYPVCPSAELADGELKRITIEGIDILVVRSGDDVVACPPLCPHQEEALDDAGVCDGGVLTCTKHLWQWDVRTGLAIGEAERSLLLYPSEIDDDVVRVFVERELRYAGDD